MRRPGHLPPLNPLKAFEVAARHLSFTQAAAELGVTQGAVSRQVKVLEDYLGIPLFVREANEIRLTPGAKQYAKTLTDVFRTVTQATDLLVDVGGQVVITLETYQTFMTRWLVPRLPDFYRNHPNYELRIITGNAHARITELQIDCSVRYGDGRWDHVQSSLLFKDQWVPICSQAFLERHSHDGHLSLFSSEHLLHHHKRPTLWQEWLKRANLTVHEPRYDMIYNHHAVIMELAQQGVGVALEQLAYVAPALANGNLVQPHPLVMDGQTGYYLTWPKSAAIRDKIRPFRDWLVAQATSSATERSLEPT